MNSSCEGVDNHAFKLNRGSFLVVAMLLSGLLVKPAHAQETAAENGALEEVTVSARAYTENVLNVPITISAVTSQDMLANNVTDFNDLQQLTPGFSFTEGGGNHGTSRQGGGLFTVRGLNDGNSDTQIFIDGAPVTGGRLATVEDAQSVEVLQGPQPVYFGRNTFNGAVNVITKTPGNTYDAQVDAGYATYDTTNLYGSGEGPLIPDKLFVRLSGVDIDKGGMYKDNATGGTLGQRNTQEGTIQLFATPTDRLSVKLLFDYTFLDDGPSAGYNMAPIEDGLLPSASNCNPKGGSAKTWFCGKLNWIELGEQRAGTNAIYDQQFSNTVIIPFGGMIDPLIDHVGFGQERLMDTAIINYKLGGTTLTTIYAYHWTAYEGVYDYDGGPTFDNCANLAGCGRPFGQNLFVDEARPDDDWSIEERWASSPQQRLRWAGGGSYLWTKAGSETNSGEEALDSTPHIALTGGKTVVKTKAVFGGLYFDATDKLTLSAEARYQWDEITSIPTLPSNTVVAGDQLSDATWLNYKMTIDGTFKNFGPRLTAQYHLNPNTMLFADYAVGFTPGNFNSQLRSQPAPVVAELVANGAQLLVQSEKLQQYEAGIKGTFFNGRFQSSLTGYVGDVTNQQVTTQAPQIVLGVTVFNPSFLSNAGRTDLYGFEYNGNLAVTDNLIVTGSYAWTPTTIKTDECGICHTLAGSFTADIGKRLPNAPDVSWNLGARYALNLFGNADWYLSGDWAHKGNVFATRLNLEDSGASDIVNMRFGRQTKSVLVEAYVTNLLQDMTPTTFAQSTRYSYSAAVAGGNFYPISLGWGFPDLRQFGVRAEYTFK